MKFNPYFQDTNIPLEKRKEEFAKMQVIVTIFKGIRYTKKWSKLNEPRTGV